MMSNQWQCCVLNRPTRVQVEILCRIQAATHRSAIQNLASEYKTLLYDAISVHREVNPTFHGHNKHKLESFYKITPFIVIHCLNIPIFFSKNSRSAKRLKVNLEKHFKMTFHTLWIGVTHVRYIADTTKELVSPPLEPCFNLSEAFRLILLVQVSPQPTNSSIFARKY